MSDWFKASKNILGNDTAVCSFDCKSQAHKLHAQMFRFCVT